MRRFRRGIERPGRARREIRAGLPGQRRGRRSGSGNPRFDLRLLVLVLLICSSRGSLAAPPDLEFILSTDLLYDIAGDFENKKYAETRQAVLGANPGLAAFDLLRDGDDITLALGVGQGPERTDIRFLGTKHDYYRMAMGVRLQETLASLTAADPNVEAVDAARRGDEIVLRVRVGPSAANAVASPQQAAGQPQEKISTPPSGEAGAAPAGAELEVAAAVPASPPPLQGVPRVEESAAVPQEAPRTKPKRRGSTPAAEVERAYRQALGENTLQALNGFLEEYPEASQVPEVERRAAFLREEAAYRTTLERNDDAGYQAFLEHFPDSRFRAEVELRLQRTEAERRRVEAERRAKRDLEKRRTDAYDEARKIDTSEAYRIFLAGYPDAPEAKDAARRLKALRADDEAYAEARGTIRGLEAYLVARPDGSHAAEARSQLQERKRAQMEADYRRAVEQGGAEALEAFLSRWPKAPKAREARAEIKRLTSRPETAPVTAGASPPDPNPGARVLVALPVRTPPAVDGRSDDVAWRAASPLDLPLNGGAGPSSVTLWALHDGKRLYLMARWADRTRDALYRPWIWDSKEDTYHQNAQVDDAFAAAFYLGQAPGDSCMLGGPDQEADTWVWRAYWSEISGFADDGRLQVSRKRLPQSNPYASRNGSGQLWVREQPDAGVPPWSFFIPVEFQGDVVPSYRQAEGMGSRTDVLAQGIWTSRDGGGAWTVELARALDTHNSDDAPLSLGGVHAFSVAIFDKSEKGQHATSPVVQLQIEEK